MAASMTMLTPSSLRFAAAAVLPLALALSACGDDDAVESAPGTEQAQAGPQFGGEVDSSPEAIAAAQAQAKEIAGGDAQWRTAPEARVASGDLPADSILNQALAGANTGDSQADCASAAEFGNEWASRLPETFPVYPGAAVTEAAGTDAGGCNLRVVNFMTAVSKAEVMNFYYTLAANEGYSTQRVSAGGEDTLGGSMAGSQFVVVGRERAGGGADFDLIVSGS